MHACIWQEEASLRPICKLQGHVTCFKTEPLLAETKEGARGMGRKFCLNCARRVRASVLVELRSDWDLPGGGRDRVPVWNPRRMAKVWRVKGVCPPPAG